MSFSIDLNCDVGEGFGPYRIGNDEAVLPNVTSANIACGFHAGDPATMRRTVQLAKRNNVAIGAHPGLPDRQGFGRREWNLSAQDAYDMVVYQVGALWGFVRAEGTELRHVKPHGALYNMAARDSALAAAIAQAVFHVDRQLILYGLAGSALIEAGIAAGLRVGREAFADRTYEQDGTLTPRSDSSAVIRDYEKSLQQVLGIVKSRSVVSRQGSALRLEADTICIHGDRADAAEFAGSIRKGLEQSGIGVSPLVYHPAAGVGLAR